MAGIRAFGLEIHRGDEQLLAHAVEAASGQPPLPGSEPPSLDFAQVRFGY